MASGSGWALRYRLHDVVVCPERATTCRRERILTTAESAIRARFVRDSFHSLNTGLPTRFFRRFARSESHVGGRDQPAAGSHVQGSRAGIAGVFDSELRLGARRKGLRTSGSAHWRGRDVTPIFGSGGGASLRSLADYLTTGPIGYLSGMWKHVSSRAARSLRGFWRCLNGCRYPNTSHALQLARSSRVSLRVPQREPASRNITIGCRPAFGR
jgi:hypothetical protein